MLKREIDSYRDAYSLQTHTLYFGGGTPSVLSPIEINDLCSSMLLAPQTEITLEMNPLSITEAYLSKLIETPINRISLGVQSWNDIDLQWLGRSHRVHQLEKVLPLLRQYGFHNVSLDLMYGIPGQSLVSLQETVFHYIAQRPQHISIYCLSLEQGSPDYTKRRQLPSDEEVASQYELISALLMQAGYEQYELSNFSLQNATSFASQHNLCYWEGKHYLGLGPSAAGYLPGYRYQNPSNLTDYTAMIEQQATPERQELSDEDIKSEWIFLHLRLMKGLDLQEYYDKFHTSFLDEYRLPLDRLMKQSLLFCDNESVRLTPKAYFISNQVFSEFV